MVPSKRRNPLAESDSDDAAPAPSAHSSKKPMVGKSIMAQRFPMGGGKKATIAKPPVMEPSAAPDAHPKASAGRTSAPAHVYDDDYDPLDAFMQNVDAQAAAEKTLAEARAREAQDAKPEKLKSAALDLDNDGDGVDAYVRFLESRVAAGGAVASGSGEAAHAGSDVDSDEEVYRVAHAMEKKMAETGQLMDSNDKREIEPLKPIDHSTVNYLEIEKDFYEEHPDIAALSRAQVAELRKKQDIKVFGADAPKPCVSFAHFGFDDYLIAAISRSEYTTPTPIQAQAIPIALSGRDVIGIAATGSGKTLAYLWPLLVHMMDQPELEKGEGPIGVILAPTRELAMQIAKEAKRYATAVYDIRVFALTGGANKADQWKALRAGVDLLIATPGRLIEMIKNKATNLRRATFLVLDEADRMLEQGFEPQVLSICNHIRPDRQATFPKKVEFLASCVTNDPLKIVVGGGTASQDVNQMVLVMDDEEDKFMWVLQNLDRLVSDGSVLVFATRKASVETLVERLQAHYVPCVALHGDMLQPEREKVVHELRTGKLDIVIATDVASRGLDIRGIRTVICYDPPRDIDTHTHRVGRTGRAGERGNAYVLVLTDQKNFAAELVPHLESAAQDVPDALLDVAMKNPRFAKMRRRRGIGSTGHGRGGQQRRGGHGGGRGRRQGLRGGYRNPSSSASMLSGGDPSAVHNNADLLMRAFKPSTKPSEMARPAASLTSDNQPKDAFPRESHHSPPAFSTAQRPPVPSVHSQLPNIDKSSDNPLLAAFAKHKARLRGEP